MKFVKIKHPKVKTDGCLVPESAVSHHEKAGWRRVEGKAPAPKEPAVQAEPAKRGADTSKESNS